MTCDIPDDLNFQKHPCGNLTLHFRDYTESKPFVANIKLFWARSHIAW